MSHFRNLNNTLLSRDSWRSAGPEQTTLALQKDVIPDCLIKKNNRHLGKC